MKIVNLKWSLRTISRRCRDCRQRSWVTLRLAASEGVGGGGGRRNEGPNFIISDGFGLLFFSFQPRLKFKILPGCAVLSWPNELPSMIYPSTSEMIATRALMHMELYGLKVEINLTDISIIYRDPSFQYRSRVMKIWIKIHKQEVTVQSTSSIYY